jgi:hypothetical protein
VTVSSFTSRSWDDSAGVLFESPQDGSPSDSEVHIASSHLAKKLPKTKNNINARVNFVMQYFL